MVARAVVIQKLTEEGSSFDSPASSSKAWKKKALAAASWFRNICRALNSMAVSSPDQLGSLGWLSWAFCSSEKPLIASCRYMPSWSSCSFSIHTSDRACPDWSTSRKVRLPGAPKVSASMVARAPNEYFTVRSSMFL